jgi:hypothetical protein
MNLFHTTQETLEGGLQVGLCKQKSLFSMSMIAMHTHVPLSLASDALSDHVSDWRWTLLGQLLNFIEI